MGKLRRRGQIFLIMTILVISFMVGITSVLLDVKESDFIEPAPDNNQALRAWEITVDSLNQIMEVYLSKSSRGVTASIVDPVDNLKAYLTSRGISNSITNTTLPTYNGDPDTTDNTATHSVTITFDIYLASSSTTIEQLLTINISYTATETGTEDTVEVYKEINGATQYIDSCDTDIAGVVDNGDGTYATPGGTMSFTTPSNVLLELDNV